MPNIRNNTARLITLGGGVTLKPGLNPVPASIWDALWAATADSKSGPGDNPATKAMFEPQGDDAKPWLEDLGGEVVEPNSPDGASDLDTLSDADAKNRISQTLDMDVLGRWKSKEKRSPVAQAIDAQLKRIEPKKPAPKDEAPTKQPATHEGGKSSK